jgi:cyclic pyranopterin phosphate synthase
MKLKPKREPARRRPSRRAASEPLSPPGQFSHLDEDGGARMVPVGAKPVQQRRAVASARLVCQPATLRALRARALPKGDVLAVAKVAGLQAAKRAGELIPLCHPLPIEHAEIVFKIRRGSIDLACTVQTSAKTGVEMEALTGAALAALTLYDMCKAVDKTMRIENVRLLEKTKR